MTLADKNTSKIGKRLKRLTESKKCALKDAAKSAGKLKEFADKEITKEVSCKQSNFFKSLSDPTRLRILGLLTVREMCVCEVMVALELTQPTASHHLKILEGIGLLKSRKEGKWVFYSIKDLKKVLTLLQFGF